MNFLDEKDGPDEIDLLTESLGGRRRAWTGPILSDVIIPSEKKMLPLFLEICLQR
jgi:hypothetical protein